MDGDIIDKSSSNRFITILDKGGVIGERCLGSSRFAFIFRHQFWGFVWMFATPGIS